MSDFIYDKRVGCPENSTSVDVTVVDRYSNSVLITVHSGTLRIPFFLTHDAATRLAAMLTNAICAYDRAVERADTAG